MKFKLVMIFFILLIIALCGTAAYFFLSDNISLIGHDITSADGQYSMRVPIQWKTSDSSSENCVLSAENSDGSMYAMVSVKDSSFEDGATMEDYVYDYINNIAENSDDPLVQVTSVAPEQSKIGDRTGYYFELDSVADGISVHTWDFIFTAENGAYVHVNVAGAGDKQDTVKSIANSIIESVKIAG